MSKVIHFICAGNTFRSRIAEAYAKSINHDPNLTFISSGIAASQDENGPISPQGGNLIHAHGLDKFGRLNWTQTTQELIDQSDVLIFVNDYDVYDLAKQKYRLTGKKIEVWHVLDLNPFMLSQQMDPTNQDERRRAGEMIYEQLAAKVRGLLEELAG